MKIHTYRKGVDGIFASIFGIAIPERKAFAEFLRRIPKQAYSTWEDSMDFFREILITNDHEKRKNLMTSYILPVGYMATDKQDGNRKNYLTMSNVAIVSFPFKFNRYDGIEIKLMQSSEAWGNLTFHEEPGKYVLLTNTDQPLIIPAEEEHLY